MAYVKGKHKNTKEGHIFKGQMLQEGKNEVMSNVYLKSQRKNMQPEYCQERRSGKDATVCEATVSSQCQITPEPRAP